MKLVRINYTDVAADCQNTPSSKFNTCFHSIDEIDLPRPSEAPYSFARWLPLILRTRNLDAAAVQTVCLSPSQAKLLVDAAAGSIITGELNRAYKEDIHEEIVPALSALHFPAEGLFMRLDGCSPKDGRRRVPGRLSLHSIDDILLCLTTSQRARNDMLKSLESHSATVEITFLPFDDRMASKREYRVYCSPGKGAITAVSQYCWHKPWAYSGLKTEAMSMVVDTIWEGIKGIHQQILADLDANSELDNLLLKQGYSFDVFYDEESETSELVELNVFGARSGCGSCLFHWIQDLALLYGDEQEVEFRATW
ncbi:hypothetical protein AK830_g9659 [Neonectria ditissima]|uniref:Cell division cycle protein 123 n=1 Tax=Neonectria ditissima TaxID=78410 RepID=A0A0P7AUB1_9HYPO|nr:hypothetical protein AK830_g9659 [Neonectria ditissima]